MSWKSIAWNAISQAQKSFDTVLSSANTDGQVGYNELDPFSSDLSGFVGTNVYTSPILPTEKTPSLPDSDPLPETSDCSDTESSNQKLDESIEGEDSATDGGLEDMPESTEFREVDLFSVPSRNEESLLDVSTEPYSNPRAETSNEGNVSNDESCNSEKPGINTEIENAEELPESAPNDDEHNSSQIPTENGTIEHENALPSSVTELQEMLRVRESKLFELHETYALLHDKYEVLRENAKSEVEQLLAEKDDQVHSTTIPLFC